MQKRHTVYMTLHLSSYRLIEELPEHNSSLLAHYDSQWDQMALYDFNRKDNPCVISCPLVDLFQNNQSLKYTIYMILRIKTYSE